MLRDFRDFIIKQNFLALAVAVVLGGWKTATWDVGAVKFAVGDFASVFLNFLIVAFVVWRIVKLFERPAPVPVPARTCQFCKLEIDAAATRCPHCTSQL